MNENKNDSLIEIALQVMKTKRKEQPLSKISKEVFEIKGIDPEKEKELLAQFQMDFMLSGLFICCGDKNGVKVWDLKNRKPSSFLDKEGTYIDDLYSDDEDVIKNELSDEIEDDVNSEDIIEDDEDEENDEETDDIEEELKTEGYYDENGEPTYEIDEDEDEEDIYDDEDK